MITKDSGIAEIFNDHFATITDSLGISACDTLLLSANDIPDPIEKAIRRYGAHPSICRITENVKIIDKFNFKEVSTADIAKQIIQLNSHKASPVDSIPARILKDYPDILSFIIQILFNSHMSNCTFPEVLKSGDIISLFKHGDASSQKSYRPITILPLISKNFRTVNAAPIASFHPIFHVLTPVWFS